jgi:hypothetical protein
MPRTAIGQRVVGTDRHSFGNFAENYGRDHNNCILVFAMTCALSSALEWTAALTQYGVPPMLSAVSQLVFFFIAHSTAMNVVRYKLPPQTVVLGTLWYVMWHAATTFEVRPALLSSGTLLATSINLSAVLYSVLTDVHWSRVA